MAKKIVVIVAGLALLVVGGTVFYVQVIRDDAPEKLDFTEEVATDESAPADDSTASSATDDPTDGEASDGVGLDGDWAASSESVVGYRVVEDFIGGLQNSEAVGRTSDVEGTFTLEGVAVSEAGFTADLTTLESDESRRDGQVQGRILNTAEFPTATFTLTSPIELDEVPPSGEEITVTTAGDLDLHGVTREVTFELRAKHTDDRIEVVGEIPIVFADYDIPNPSNPFVSTRDNGLLEFLLVLEPA